MVGWRRRGREIEPESERERDRGGFVGEEPEHGGAKGGEWRVMLKDQSELNSSRARSGPAGLRYATRK